MQEIKKGTIVNKSKAAIEKNREFIKETYRNSDLSLKSKLQRKRKNWMRNKPCLCGSGKKFKNCCWCK